MTEEKKEIEKRDVGVSLGNNRSIYSSKEAFDGAQRIAASLAACDFVPDAYRGNVPNTLLAIEMSNRLGRADNPPSILAVMQNLYVVKGKPSFESKFIIALVNTCGLFSPLRWEYVGQEGSTTRGARAVCRDLRTDEILRGTLVDMEMAKKEGWLDKNGSKWQTMPEQMLKYRSASFWQKAYCPELTMGIGSADELHDVPEPEVIEATVITNPLDTIAERIQSEDTE